MKKIVLSICFLLVAFLTATAGTGGSVQTENLVPVLASLGSIENAVVVTANTENVVAEDVFATFFSCTVEVYGNISYGGQNYTVHVTATASTCSAAGAAAGAAIDNLQKQYNQQ